MHCSIRNVTAGDFKLYDIIGIHLIDSEQESLDVEEIGTIPVYGRDVYEKHILDHNI